MRAYLFLQAQARPDLLRETLRAAPSGLRGMASFSSPLALTLAVEIRVHAIDPENAGTLSWESHLLCVPWRCVSAVNFQADHKFRDYKVTPKIA